jgi:hypothetical protein
VRRKFWSENLNGRDHLEHVGVDRRIILEWVLDVNWIHVDQVRVQWWSLVNTIMNFGFHKGVKFLG